MRGVKGFVQICRSEGWRGIVFDLAERLWRVYFRWARRQNLPVVHTAYGVKLTSNYSDSTFRYCVTGKYGLFLARRIKAISIPFCFLDIGANQGLYCLLAGANDNATSAYAFEPVPETADRLRANILLNNQSERVHVIQAAISSQDGARVMATNAGHTGQARIIDRNSTPPKLSQLQEVDALSGKSLASILGDEDVPVYVKVDVEGHEGVVVGELLRSPIEPRIQEIFFEVDETWTEKCVLFALLGDAGFSLERIGGGHHYDMLAVRTTAAS